jgi:hypothetical protein
MEGRIIRTWREPYYQDAQTPKIRVVIMYQADNWPPRTVWIPEELYTAEAERAAIEADVKANPPQAPRTFAL